MKRELPKSLSVAALCFVTACASLPSNTPPAPSAAAVAPDPNTVLGRQVAAFNGRHGSGVCGFAPVDANGDGLRVRLALVDSAERSLDMLYYLWYRDFSGLILLEHVIEAAERGVHVRVVVDDTLFVKGKQGLANLEAHPNIEVRIFNPWVHKGVGRVFETIGRAKRLNHRMHDKLLVADTQAAVLGGRNVGDHYFGLHHKYNFHDLDIVVAGEAAVQTSEIFDHFWNSERVFAATAFVEKPSWSEIENVRAKEIENIRKTAEQVDLPIRRGKWDDEIAALFERMSPGTSTPEYDRVLPGSATPSQDGVTRLAEIVEQAQREVLITNAYIIPGTRMLETLRAAVARGVRIRMLTNSLASNDVPAVTAKYGKYRKVLLETGVELYEFRAHPAIQPGIVDTEPVEARFAGLHTKAAVVDREIVYVGSLNLDPRSFRLNTEMGMVVSSPGLAEEIAAIADRDMAPENSWRVLLDAHDKLYWKSTAGIVTRQPAQGLWQRIQYFVFKIVPESQL